MFFCTFTKVRILLTIYFIFNALSLFAGKHPEFPDILYIRLLSDKYKSPDEIPYFRSAGLSFQGSLFNEKEAAVYGRFFRYSVPATADSVKLVTILNEFRGELSYEWLPVRQHFTIPNDYTDENRDKLWHLALISAQDAWNITQGNNAPPVAVIDDGMNIYHQDISANLYQNPYEIPNNGIDDDANGYIDDFVGYDVADMDADVYDSTLIHGTFVGGAASAVTNNDFGIASIGYHTPLLPVKASNLSGFITHPYEGIIYAVRAGAKVMNLSWGGFQPSEAERAVIQYALDNGCTVVAAAGNWGNSGNPDVYPAKYQGVICVAATNPEDKKAGFSNYGPHVTLSAPGSYIYTTSYKQGFGASGGTSFATPQVAATAALMLELNPHLTASQIKGCLRKAADPIDDLNPGLEFTLGTGRLNTFKSLVCALAPDFSAPETLLSLQDSTVCPGMQNILMTEILNGNPDSIVWVLPPGVSVQHQSGGRFAISATLAGIYTVKLKACQYNLCDTSTILFTVRDSSSFVQYGTTFSINLASSGWEILNGTPELIWEKAPVRGYVDTDTAMKLNFFQSLPGRKASLISPSFDLSQVHSPELIFDHAWAYRNTEHKDTLILSVSTADGDGFPYTVLKIPGSEYSELNSIYTICDTAFTPRPDQWCRGCVSVSLAAFEGRTNIRIRFQGISASGQNLWIDNVSIRSLCAPPSNIPPEAEFSISPQAVQQKYCSWQPLTFRTVKNDNLLYRWYFPGAFPAYSEEASPEVKYPAPGSYHVRLAVTNFQGYDSISVDNFVEIAPDPVLAISSEATAACFDIPLEVIASGAYMYKWNDTGSFSFTNRIRVLPQDTVKIKLVGRSIHRCLAFANRAFPYFDQSPDVPVILAQGYRLSPQNSNPVNTSGYFWYRNDSLIESLPDGTLMAPDSGKYTLCRLVNTGCFTCSEPYLISIPPPSGTNPSVFPNPSDGVYLFSGSESMKGMNFSITDINGKILHQGVMANLPHTIDIRNMAAGVYVLRAGTFRTRLIKR